MCDFICVHRLLRPEPVVCASPNFIPTAPPPCFHPVSLSCSLSSSLWNYLPPHPGPASSPLHPTVPCLGTGLSSEVTLTLARALPPLNPISRHRYCQPACSNRYGGKVGFYFFSSSSFFFYIHLINVLSLQ